MLKEVSLGLFVRMFRILLVAILSQLLELKLSVFSPEIVPKWFQLEKRQNSLLGWKMLSPLNIITIEASVHLPFDHRMLVQNLTAQVFDNASVPPSTQATFPYIFALSKFLQKTKAASKVEVGTGTTDASMDEWLQGTAYNQSSSKSKKKK
ncbi:hypothetical protein ERO13_A12G039300v2 [Gossypium hirsutum]|nr:hypothetical protein ERO13_A12G039300v2 [Gossypium hirsutum]